MIITVFLEDVDLPASDFPAPYACAPSEKGADWIKCPADTMIWVFRASLHQYKKNVKKTEFRPDEYWVPGENDSWVKVDGRKPFAAVSVPGSSRWYIVPDSWVGTVIDAEVIDAVLSGTDVL